MKKYKVNCQIICANSVSDAIDAAKRMMKDDVTDNQIQYIRERGKDIAVFADALKKLQRGEKVTGYASAKDVADEIVTFAKGIIEVCGRIK